MMGAKQKNEDQSRRPIIAMEEDRHQTIMSSVALKKGVDRESGENH